MRRILAALILIASAAAGPSRAQIVINAPPATAGHPWRACPDRPGSRDIVDYVPARAKRAGLTGSIDIQCKVSASGRTQACTWIRETPKGYGFGPAAAKFGCLLRVQPQFLRGVGPNGVRVSTTLHMRPTRGF